MDVGLNRFSWYHGKLSRHECEAILNRDSPGLFLVRDSNTMPGDYVLSVKEIGKVSHYIINRTGFMYKIGEQEFKDLPAIIEFYKKHFLDNTTLVEPAVRHGFQDTAVAQTNQSPSNNSLKVRAKFNFVGNDAEDLSFKKGDILTIVRKEEEDWWLARNAQGNEGLIPKPYVEELPSSTTRQPSRITSYPSPSAPDGRTNPDRFSTGPSYSQPIVTPSAAHEVSISNLPPGPVMARAIQAREPSFYDPTELKFQKNDRIRVLKRNENGIWEGENLENGHRGHFPFTFVKILMDQS